LPWDSGKELRRAILKQGLVIVVSGTKELAPLAPNPTINLFSLEEFLGVIY